MDAALKALAEPRRRAILRLVWSQELPATEIAGQFPDVSRPAISQHLAVLKDAELVTERRDGTRRLYRANTADDGRAARVPRRLLDLRPRATARRRRGRAGPQATRPRKAGSDGRARPRDRDRRHAGDDLAVPRRPRHGTSSGWAPRPSSTPARVASTACSSAARHRSAGEFVEVVPAGEGGVHLRVGAGGQPDPAGLDHRRDHACTPRATRPGCGSSTAACPTTPSPTTPAAGTTTSAGSRSSPPAATAGRPTTSRQEETR